MPNANRSIEDQLSDANEKIEKSRRLLIKLRQTECEAAELLAKAREQISKGSPDPDRSIQEPTDQN